MAAKRKWWPDSILGRFAVGVVLAWIGLIVVVSVLAFVAQRAISPGSGHETLKVSTAPTQSTKSTLP